jgi:hypothetical protein
MVVRMSMTADVVPLMTIISKAFIVTFLSVSQSETQTVFPSGLRFVLDSADEAELGKCSHTIIQATLFNDLAVFETEHRRPGEVHLAARVGRQ